MRFLLAAAVIILFTAEISAQSSSGYSRFGIGDLEYTYSARRVGMGGLGVSVEDIDFIGTLNPASWYAIARTRIEFGGSYKGLLLSDQNESNKYYSETEFTGFTLAFPVSNTYGISLATGIIPYSKVSYNAVENIIADPQVGNYSVDYKGRGGLSKFFIGTSYKLPFNFVLGASLDYYFGNLVYETALDFASSAVQDIVYQRIYKTNGIGTTAGIISPDFSSILKSESITDLKLGASFQIFNELKTDTLLWTRTATLTDTLTSGKVKMKLPLRLNAGFSFVLNKDYLFLFDYAFQPWSKYRLAGLQTQNLRDANKISAGFEYRPSKELGATLWEQIILRAGLSFEQTQYLINGEGIDQYAVMFGFSFPIMAENTIDIALQYASKGTTKSGLIKENIFKLSFGISLGEIWFIRYEK